MKFVYPEFLWSLLLLAIPIIIHLFNFRRYKTLYFSSLQFIKHVDQQTRSTQKLKHLLVLLSRIFALAALVVAFAQPYKPVSSTNSTAGKPVLAIYIDNSFSMTAKGTEGELLSEAREVARKIIEKASLNTLILLHTNKMSGIEQHFISRAEALDRLDKITPIPLTRQIDDVITWQRNFIEKESETNQRTGSKQHILLSDFQKSTSKFVGIAQDNLSYYYPILFKPQEFENICVDSVWFTSPIRKVGSNNELNIRVVNNSDKEITNAEIHCDIDGVKRDVFLDLQAKSTSTTVINYTERSSGMKKGKISVNDKQLFWDDDFYFSYTVDNQTGVLVINGEGASQAVTTVYSLEKYYNLKSIEENAFSLDELKNIDLVVVNGMNEIPSGTIDELRSFVQSGGTLALFPGPKAKLADWNNLLTDIKMPNLNAPTSAGSRIDKLIYEDPFFYGMFEKKKDNLNLPAIKKYYRPIPSGNSAFFELIKLQSGSPLLMRSDGALNVFLFSGSLDSEFGTFTSDALFPSVLLRIAEMSQRKAPISLTIGKESYYPLYKKQSSETPVHLKNGKVDFIPRVQKEGLISYIALNGEEALEMLPAGCYELIDEKTEAIVALNYDRLESSTDCYTKDEILNQMEEQGIKNISSHEVNEGQSVTKIDIEKPFEYWKLFIALSLVFLLAEMALIKFWK